MPNFSPVGRSTFCCKFNSYGQERQRIAPEQPRLEEERKRKAAEEKALQEEQERQRKGAEEKAKLQEDERQRVIAGATRIVEERRQAAAAAPGHVEKDKRDAAERIRPKQEETIVAFDKAVQDGLVEQVPANRSVDPTSDEGDAVWEAERQRRRKELTKAIVAEWSAYGNVADEREESEAITKLKSALNAWLSQRPSGFESREAIRREQQEAAVRKAAETWRLRTGG